MKTKNPSPKVLAFLLIVAILTTVAIVSSKFIGKGSSGLETEQKQIDLVIKNNLDYTMDDLDSDGDGLPDWQEEIWGTDKNNPDTDGDGTSDGDEVAQGRNPLVAGPNDKILSDDEVFREMFQSTPADPNSVTNILSKNLLLRLAQIEQAGQYNQQAGDELAQDLVSQISSLSQIPDKYPVNLFLTFNKSDAVRLNEYADKIRDIQMNELLKINPNNSDLDPLINAYKNIAFSFSTMGVPSDLVGVHAKITNGYYIAAEALINLKLSDKDPVLGILSIPIYRRISEEQPILFKQVENYLTSNGIILNTSTN